jgi:hypothetical protein
MMAKTQLIEDIQDQAREFKDLVSSANEEEFEAKRFDGRWGYREVMAHLTGWQGQLAAGLRKATEQPGTEMPPPGQPDMEWNDIFAEHARGKQRDQVLQEFDDGVSTFVSTAIDAPEDLFHEGRIGDRLAREDLARFRQHIDMVKRMGD